MNTFEPIDLTYMNKDHSFADRVIAFNRSLAYSGKLPAGFRVMNPYLDNPETPEVMEQFYRKYYNDRYDRKFIIGINPSRKGGGVTGIPFTDTKRLEQVCGIRMHSAVTHEPSSVFVYDLIAEYGGPEVFYREFYIHSPFPLAIVKQAVNGQWLNANYYDDPALFACVKDFMIDSLKQHIRLGLDTSRVFVLGKKNADFIRKLDREAGLFGHIEVLEHPRFIQQYKSKEKQQYIDKYLLALNGKE